MTQRFGRLARREARVFSRATTGRSRPARCQRRSAARRQTTSGAAGEHTCSCMQRNSRRKCSQSRGSPALRRLGSRGPRGLGRTRQTAVAGAAQGAGQWRLWSPRGQARLNAPTPSYGFFAAVATEDAIVWGVVAGKPWISFSVQLSCRTSTFASGSSSCRLASISGSSTIHDW